MGKNVHNNMLDAALNHLKNNGNRLVVLTAEPTGASAYVNAMANVDSSGYRLASATITASDFTGPADGDTSGRKITVNAQTSMSIDGIAALSQDATHVAVVQYHASSASAQNVLYTTTCTTQSLTAGNKVNTPAWVVELRSPT
jgi:hypothetical protein